MRSKPYELAHPGKSPKGAGRTMGKKGSGSVPQKHLHSRLSYLYQASIYLDNAKQKPALPEETTQERLQDTKIQPAPEPQSPTTEVTLSTPTATPTPSLESQYLLTSLRSISQRAQIRISPSIKRTICRRCNVLLSPPYGTVQVENLSRGGRKAHADVLLVICGRCGAEKRYPVGMGEGGVREGKEREEVEKKRIAKKLKREEKKKARMGSKGKGKGLEIGR